MKLLLVEDEVLVRMVASEVLSDAGFKVVEAGTADEALKLLDASFSALVTDIEMPGSMDGLRLAQTVADKWPQLAILLVSGRRLPLVRELPGRAEMLTKPYTAQRLIDTVADLIAAQSVTGPHLEPSQPAFVPDR
jgi:CheY-like chemotaxis protein